MGLFSFLKRKKKENIEVVKEKIAFSEIDRWIKNKINKEKLKEKEVISEIKVKITYLDSELKEKIYFLREIDISQKKEKEQIKEVVSRSRNNYIGLVETFLERLKNLELENLELFIGKVNKIFIDFEKSSFKNYERVTILIGKETANVKKSIKEFAGDLLKIYNENKNITYFFKKIQDIELKYNHIQEIDKQLKEILGNKEELKKGIDKSK